MDTKFALPLGIAGAGVACLTYAAAYEARSFRLRRVEVPVLPRGLRPLRVLQVSDIHMVCGQRKKQDWLRRLAALRPDFVLNTGDNLSDPEAALETLDALAPLMELPGAYVFGSNDYFAPRPKDPTSYLRRDDGTRRLGDENPWRDLRDGFDRAGWENLNNARGRLKLDSVELELVGLDDPHIDRDRYESVAGGPDRAADFSLAVVHAPYRRALDAFTTEGYPLVIAGHTHGGQVCVPFYGALTTNCDLDRKRAKGLSRYASSGNETYLHVSAGCGTSRYARFRFACPPEATLLTLTPA
ncbi:metallophosphoesterase [Yinghuangia sp. ASG 101]|uniref:metallophosphoesterase n=1 Tax=Yinghuangia sp. ASG 101 TaxID=2896848 RepID=UPI001E3824EC|nr:metallophosphoesterase [Yinghuangia sp. ASG 101]UGQ09079.1 metallophosphoesterase [Yinghuangia sp. ASG 101]